MSVTAQQIAEWQQAVGRTVTRRQVLDLESLRRFVAATGGDPDAGGPVPPLAHWAWFLDVPGDGEIGPDGHPKRGAFLPPVTLPRRMFAASAVEFHTILRAGAEAELVGRIADVRHRSGAAGDLVFVDVERRLSQDQVLCLTERQTLVYREAAEAGPLPVPDGDAGKAPTGGELWRPAEVNLFRFSAATFNGHRIHYDWPYATGVEGYPALVVQGPFTAARLARLAAREGKLAALEFRLLAPLYAGQPVRLAKTDAGEFSAIRCDGAVATSLKAMFR